MRLTPFLPTWRSKASVSRAPDGAPVGAVHFSSTQKEEEQPECRDHPVTVHTNARSGLRSRRAYLRLATAAQTARSSATTAAPRFTKPPSRTAAAASSAAASSPSEDSSAHCD